MRTGTSPTSAGTVIHVASTSGLAMGTAWMSSRTFRAPSGPSSYRNGGFEVASAISCAAGSSVCLVMGAPFRIGHHAASLPWHDARICQSPQRRSPCPPGTG